MGQVHSAKRKFGKEQLKLDGRKIQNAEEMVRFLREENNKFHVGPPSSKNSPVSISGRSRKGQLVV